MAVVSMKEVLRSAFHQRYGVGAFNIVNELSMAAVLDAAAQTKSPVIIQVSVKTVKVLGARLLQLMFAELASQNDIPATLHLDHCPDPSVIRACFEAGWNSVLFDASNLNYEDNLKQTKEVVAMARSHGAAVEGELEAVRGVEDGVGSEEESALVSLDRCVRFLEETGVDSFAPAIGTAHGLYQTEPIIDFDRVDAIVRAHPTPIVLHGGTGLSNETIQRLIAAGCAKVNISTMLKIVYCDSYRKYLEGRPKERDPLKVMSHVHCAILEMAKGFMEVFGSVGKAVSSRAGVLR
jgi:fructose-bisphosphate aldolase, class II